MVVSFKRKAEGKRFLLLTRIMRSAECTREVGGWQITLDFLVPTYCCLFQVPLFIEQVEKAFTQRGPEVREEILVEMAIRRDEKYRLNSGDAGFTHK